MKVAYKNIKTGAMTEVTADYCVSCLPLTILSRLDVEPVAGDDGGSESHALQPEREDGAADEAPVLGGGRQDLRRPLYSNLPFGNFSYPSWGYFGDKGMLLGFYGNGQMAGLINMPIKDRIEHVLTHASKVHPQIRAEYETAYCTFWEKTPYSLGAFAAAAAAAPTAGRLAVLNKPDNRIFIGCAAISGNGGWQEGAVSAAWKQVKPLHEHVMTTTRTAA